jgi:predicted SnoaL-like aldol condensation-catalyzing enzyme
MSNKELFERSLAEFMAGNVDVLRSVLREDFVEHSPGNPSGRDAFVEFIAASPVANARITMKRVVAEGEYVVAHYHMTHPDHEHGMAVVDIWRLEDGLIVEHWDVVQPVPEPATVPHGML